MPMLGGEKTTGPLLFKKKKRNSPNYIIENALRIQFLMYFFKNVVVVCLLELYIRWWDTWMSVVLFMIFFFPGKYANMNTRRFPRIKTPCACRLVLSVVYGQKPSRISLLPLNLHQDDLSFVPPDGHHCPLSPKCLNLILSKAKVTERNSVLTSQPHREHRFSLHQSQRFVQRLKKPWRYKL